MTFKLDRRRVLVFRRDLDRLLELAHMACMEEATESDRKLLERVEQILSRQA